MEKIQLHIEGMHCGSCAVGIQMLVSEMEGVSSVAVDYEKKSGVFEFDSSKTTKEKIISEIATLGYQAS
jgi:copper chaperone CopZ